MNLNFKKRPISAVADNVEVRNAKKIIVKVQTKIKFSLLYDKNSSLQKKIKLFSRITNTLAKEKQIEDEKRKFDSPAASRHLANNIDPKIIKNLRDTVVASYQNTSHRYYRLKAKILNKKKLNRKRLIN